MADGTLLIRKDEEKQRYRRASILCDGCLEVAGRALLCDILDISAGGAKITTDEPLPSGESLVLQIGDLVALPGKLAWQRDGQAGIEFAVASDSVAEILPAILDGPAKTREKRGHLRSTVLWSGEVLHESRTVSCRLLNISAHGAKIRLDADVPVGAEVTVACSRFGEVSARVVWAEAGKIGVEFLESPNRLLRAIGNAVTPVRDLPTQSD